MPFHGKDLLRLVAALLVAVSGGIHFRLYRTEYRDIHVDRVLGVDLAASFVVAVLLAAIVSIALVAVVIWRRWERAASVAGIWYAAGAIATYALTRTVGFLGFEENAWTVEAAVSKGIEVAVIALLAASLLPAQETSSASPTPNVAGTRTSAGSTTT